MGKAKRRVRGIGVLLLAVLWFGTVMVPSAGADADSKKLHPRLSRLADPGNNQTVDVIVAYEPGTGTKSIEQASGGKVIRQWPFINAAQVRMPANKLRTVAGVDGVRFVSPNSPTRFSTSYDVAGAVSHYQAALKLNKFWSAGYFGQGIGVAVIDSGVAPVPALKDRLVSVAVGSIGTTQDVYGHGTHVAGIIAADAGDGLHEGVAPKATVYNLRVAANDGSATESDIVSALDWIYRNHRTYNIRIVNISMQAGIANDYTTSPLDAAVEKLWFDGVVVVVSAGNRGTVADAEFYPPSNDPYVITVGAMDDMGTALPDDDNTVAWSSQGTTQSGTAKPDLLAPGRRDLSTLAPGSTLAAQYPQLIEDGSYIALSGSSMAAPTISGMAALMLGLQPALQPDQVKAALKSVQRSVVGQPAGGAGVPDGDLLYDYIALPGPPGTNNQGLTPSLLLSANAAQFADALSQLNVYYQNVYYLNISPDSQYYGQ